MVLDSKPVMLLPYDLCVPIVYSLRVFALTWLRRGLIVGLSALLVWAVFVTTGRRDAPAPPLSLRSEAVQFQLPVALQPDETIALSDFSGKGVVVNFWATWCEPCIAELPLLRRLHERYAGQDLVVLSVTDDDPDDVTRFLRTESLPFPVLLDPEGRLRSAYGAEVLPYTVFIGPDGRVAGARAGMLLEPRDLEPIERLVALSRQHRLRGAR